MSNSVKVTIVVVVFGIVLFWLARPIAARFGSDADFTRRRNIWFVLTLVALLSTSFWLFVAVAAPLLYWGARKDANPLALYLLMLHVIPSIDVRIPPVFVNDLFALNIYRLLSICVLIPLARKLRKSPDANHPGRFDAMDWLLIGYGALETALFIRPDIPNAFLLHDSPTSVIRRAFLYYLDAYVVYYVVSRWCTNRQRILEAMAAFCLSCVIMAAIGSIESVKHWWMYSEIATNWGEDPAGGAYLMRGDTLRAQASSGHSLALGYLLAIGFGFWLALKSQVQTTLQRVLPLCILSAGLLAAYSRGPWVGTLAIYFTFAAVGPNSVSRTLKAATGAVLIGGLIMLSPVGDQIAKVIPFLGGTVDSGSVTYRQMLLDRSLELLRLHPFLGDQEALTKMNDLRQGQGIIDLVNSYASVALFYGLVGLSLFVGFLLLGLTRSFQATRQFVSRDPTFALVGASLVACLIGTMIMIGSCSFILGYQKMYYILGGFATAYYKLAKATEPLASAATALVPPG